MEPQARPFGAARAALLAWGAVGVVNVIATNVAPSSHGSKAALRLVRGTYDLGYALALGLFSCLAVLAWSRLKRAIGPRLSPRAAFAADIAAVAAVAFALGFPVLGPDLVDFTAGIVEERKLSPALVKTGLILAVAAGIPVVLLVGRLLARPGKRVFTALRLLVALAAIGLAVWNHALLTTDYPGAHLYVAWAAALLGSAALAAFTVTSASPTRARKVVVAVLLAGATALAAWSVVFLPRQVIMLALLEERAGTIATFLMRARRVATVSTSADVPPELRAWFTDRSAAPSIPPTQPIARSNQIVILYTVDSLRAEVVESGNHDDELPVITKLRNEGTHFTEARAPGTGTAFSLSALFMGKYYSEQYWTPRPGHDSVYPWEDESLRFTEILSSRGVKTVAYVSRKFMHNEYGIARGFDESVFIPPVGRKGRSPTGRQIGAASLKRLEKHGDGPLFIWIHNMDAHAPFDMVPGKGTHHERYVREVGLVDKEIGLVRDLVARKGWTDRTTFILSSDHGEGFMEHGTRGHSVSMYEELLRIPIVVTGPGVKAREERAPVSLIDIGATVLDIFGQHTPGTWLGQSLVPALRGDAPKLTRPICAETRLKQTIILPGGLKLIRDQRLGTREIYDLATDPGEKRNLYDEPGADREAQMSVLAAFFDAHTLKRPGYTPPYRTW